MSLIEIPADELRRVADLLQRTKDLMGSDLVKSMGDVVEALADQKLETAAWDFEKAWGDGRYVLGRDLDGLRDASRAVADAFQQTDEQTVNALTEGENGQ
ncbi:hypothetical protein [Kibdelosporangium aridum]|uniref:WXG100 family type VII secretion target n=1 Tax=Kibdelosporangium aridum TaxID=2030 RepID=A0A1Y5XDM7_KIBAR|nr:hypothetical protein [Kibdelosporangium aridum]RSM63854.1 hypothetical protein DMH04_52530 [Kibdelosporangium aridum]SMC83719.1 hypothetical protein SAMN05661093_01949 [Kibdelosporangium aridum]